MNEIKRNKGITLIALIITIVVLLILAVVAIQAVSGDGIIANAKKAATKYHDSGDYELLALSIQAYNLSNIRGNSPESLVEYLVKEEWCKSVIDNGDGTVTVIIEECEHEYSIDMNKQFEIIKVVNCDHINKQVTEAIQSTCATIGYTEEILCLDCGRIIKAKIEIPKDLSNHTGGTEIRNASDTYTGDTYCLGCKNLIIAGSKITPKIPEGGTYYVGVTSTKLGTYIGATSIYTEGQNFPDTVKTVDVYVYGDYEYRYNYYYFYSTNGTIPSEWRSVSDTGYVAAKHTETNGWGVRVRENKSEYQEMLSYINNEPVKNLVNTFAATVVKIAPAIPTTVICMYDTFYSCNYLTTAPTIPISVNTLNGAFTGCPKLTGEIEINCSYLISNSQPIYDGAGVAFGTTKLPIKIVGSCSTSIKSRLAASAQNKNVTY